MMGCEWVAGTALIALLILSFVWRKELDAMGPIEGIFAFLFLGLGLGLLAFLVRIVYIVTRALMT